MDQRIIDLFDEAYKSIDESLKKEQIPDDYESLMFLAFKKGYDQGKNSD